MAGRLTPRELEYRSLVEQLDALRQDIEAARKLARRTDPGAGSALDLHPEAPHPVHGEEVELPDGARILVRPTEPADLHALDLGFKRLGALSRYRRFRRRVEHLDLKQLVALTEVDHRSAEVFLALDPMNGDGVGIAHYARDPEDPEHAEVDCTVVDAWQHRGVGTILATRLGERALAAGIRRLTAHVLVGDEAARRLVRRTTDVVTEEREGGIVAITARIRDREP